MMDLVDKLAALIRLNGGKIVGKTRLQKIAYLLEAKGIGLGADFDYHNYGPFSAELAFAADDAKALGLISTEDHPGHHAIPYTVFLSCDLAPVFPENDVTTLRRKALRTLDPYSALVLELAATAAYLKRHGYPDGAWNEVRRRKPLKATPDRMALAERLITELEL